jgi:hypothetical protein
VVNNPRLPDVTALRYRHRFSPSVFAIGFRCRFSLSVFDFDIDIDFEFCCDFAIGSAIAIDVRINVSRFTMRFHRNAVVSDSHGVAAARRNPWIRILRKLNPAGVPSTSSEHLEGLRRHRNAGCDGESGPQCVELFARVRIPLGGMGGLSSTTSPIRWPSKLYVRLSIRTTIT